MQNKIPLLKINDTVCGFPERAREEERERERERGRRCLVREEKEEVGEEKAPGPFVLTALFHRQFL